MRLIIEADYGAVAEWVADHVVTAIRGAATGSSPDRPFVLGLPSGKTAKGIYDALVRRLRGGRGGF